MKILGLSALYHDSAAALVVDGKIVAAAQEERFTRKKHDSRLPTAAIEFCLRQAGIELAEVDHIAFYDKPFLKFERLLETYLATAPRGFRSFRTGFPIWIKEKLFQRRLLQEELSALDPKLTWPKNKLLFSEHHLSHAASAFFPSPFAEAAVLTMDGVGEWTTTSLAIGKGRDLKIQKEIHFPHSLGLLYSAFTYQTGFKVNSGEYKLMGLAPYGQPVYRDLILEKLIDLKPDGTFRLNLDYFDYCSGLRMTNRKFDRLFGLAARQPNEPIEQIHMDLAASIQAVTEEAVLRLARAIALETKQKNLCLAGGVALNCVANGKLAAEGYFENIWVQPAAGDAGGALGAALAAHHLFLKQERHLQKPDAMQGSYLGPAFSQAETEAQLRAAGAKFEALDDETLFRRTTEALVAGKAVAWVQGRMEFGPRALGNRSILADPRSPKMQSTLNLKVKFRESFRPFAPAVLAEEAGQWFELNKPSPYMLLVAPVANDQRKKIEGGGAGFARLSETRSTIPAITHVDYSARVQTVEERTNPRFHRLLKLFQAQTGCPVLINTSFNIRGEPIVHSPTDAFRCFMGTELDLLVVENCFLEKTAQDPALAGDYRAGFELD